MDYEYKKCGSCKTEKATVMFSKDNKSSDGFHGECKYCCAQRYYKSKLAGDRKPQAFRRGYREYISSL